MKDKKRSYKPWCNVVLVLFIVGISSGVFYIFQNQKQSLEDMEYIRSLNKQEKEIRKTLVSKKKMPSPELNELFAKWDAIIVKNAEVLEHQQISADQNFSIWLTVIAAICTILPVVLGINQSLSFHNQLESAKAEMEKKVLEAERKMNELQKKQVAYNLQSFVNTLSMNIKILGDWEELEVGQNPFLTSRSLLKAQMSKMVEYSSKCNDEYLSIEKQLGGISSKDIEILTNSIKDNALDLLLLLNNLLKKYEVFFDRTNLFELHTIMDEIWYNIDDILDDKNTIKDLKIYIMVAHKYCKQIEELFLKQFAKE